MGFIFRYLNIYMESSGGREDVFIYIFFLSRKSMFGFRNMVLGRVLWGGR